INKSATVTCPACYSQSETVQHFLLFCPFYSKHCAELFCELGWAASFLSQLLI
ncbi:hypothetical protein BKA93DRAFT_728534, partial [Sparassis latifolia]